MAIDARSRASDHGAGEEMAGDDRAPHEKLHRDGSLWGRGHLVNGAMHGYWEFFRKDGTLMRSGAFDCDGQVGEWVTYDKAGDPSKVTQFGS